MKALLYWLFFGFVLMAAAGNSGCANIVPPQGGPRDTLPPVLLQATPPDSTLNFSGSRITLTFDEYIDLQEVQNNLLFTPTFANNPEVLVKLKTITVRFRDTLDPNTTYIFNFGSAIKDYNEGNVLRNFVYTFSTGPALDSLQLNGKVVMAETGAIDTTLTVILHKNLDDSAVVKERPRYVARLDGTGAFRFKNLPPGTFALYALGDAGIARRYQNKTQSFAFADSAIVVSETTKPVTLYAYKEASGAPNAASTLKTSLPGLERNRLKFTTNVANGSQQDLLQDLEMTFEQPLRLFDSTRLSLTTDSTFQPAVYSVALDSAKKKLTIKTEWLEGTQYNLITTKDFAEDTLGQQLLKSDTLQFTTRERGDYGSLTLRINNLDTAHNPVLQFVQNGVVVSSGSIRSGFYHAELFLPGEYEVRILFDNNNNGIWDAGQFFGTKQQPELVRPIERRITVKASFDNDFDLAL